MVKSILSIPGLLWNPTPENGYKPAKNQMLLFLTIAMVYYLAPVNIRHLLYELGLYAHPTGNRYRGNMLAQMIGVVVTLFGLRAMSFMFPETWYKIKNRHGHHCLNLWQNLVYWGVFFAVLMIDIM